MRGQAGPRVVGREYTSQELATILNKQAPVLRAAEGGVTFSGGEPLMQAEFVAEVCDRLHDLHIVLDTSGYAREASFRLLAEKCDLIYYDLKIIDSDAHRSFTGVDNTPILSNLRLLGAMSVPSVIRVPLVPGVTDTDENLARIASTVLGLPGLLRVDLLPYNQAAGGKYESLGMEFRPAYDEQQEVNLNTQPFERVGLPVRVANLGYGGVHRQCREPDRQTLQ